MTMTPSVKELAHVIRQVQEGISWKPGSAMRHLHKRKLRRHLPVEATIADYENIIDTILKMSSARVYLYWYNDVPYPTIVGHVRKDLWLVMFSFEGIMESAFVIENPQIYLSPPQFEQIGLLGEVLDENE
jgi:hypothetical protein